MIDQSVSTQVKSKQREVHPRLAALVRSHMESNWRQALHRPSISAFEALEGFGAGPDRRIVFDSGCGTGVSTRLIAEAMPECLVIGVDKSLHRLQKLPAGEFPHREGNAVWVRAELTTFWRLALQSGWRLERHYLLYPNPWPKPSQLRRRWHAHPIFPDLLRLGGRIEMRCNWRIYAEEFALAAEIVSGQEVRAIVNPEPGIETPFERKYRRSGHSLYSVIVSAPGGIPATD